MRLIFKTPVDVLLNSFTQWKNNLYHSSALDIAKQRVMIVGCTILLAFLAVIIRLGDVMLLKQRDRAICEHMCDFHVLRSDIVDANGQILATNIPTGSAYINPKHVINIKQAAEKLATVLKDVNVEHLEKKIRAGKNFVWLARHISPKMQADLMNLGIPGVYIYRDQTRVYPHGSLLSHILGMCGIDGNGLSGVEAFFDARLQEDRKPVALSIDLRVQHILHNELTNAVNEFSANGANAVVMRVNGEVLGMVSLPDYDPHAPGKYDQACFFNRNTLGSYEPGSVFKILNIAIALETGKATLNSIYDGSAPIQIGRFKVTDFKGLNRPMTLVEAFTKSSNIAAVKISQQFGPEIQKEYMKKFGVLSKVKLELPELGGPLIPKNWTSTSMMTISYGYGVSQTPLQLLSVIGSVINKGRKVTPTLLKADGATEKGEVILNEKISAKVRHLMRKVVCEGTARKADAPGFDVFGKTGTAYQKNEKGGYGTDANRKRTTTFIGGFPENDPEIILIVMMDDPKPTKETAGYATAGWNAAKVAGNIIKRVAPLFLDPQTPQDDPFADVKPDISTQLLEEDDHFSFDEKALQSIDALFDGAPKVQNISAKNITAE